MNRSFKLTLPLLAAALMLVGWSITAAVAQPAAATGKIKVTVKSADGMPAAELPLALHKGSIELPARGGGGGGAPPASQPAALKEGTTDAQGVFTFEGLAAGDYTVLAGRGGRGGGGGRGAGGAPGAGAPPAGGAPGAGAPPGGGRGGRGGGARGRGFGTVKAGETLEMKIELMAGRGGRGGGGGGAPPAGGAAPGGARGQGA